MVQLLADPTLAHAVLEGLEGTTTPDHAPSTRDASIKSLMRAPRRGWSLTDHRQATPDALHFHSTTIPEHAALYTATRALPRRPPMSPPRRSHSVTDKEPEPATSVPRESSAAPSSSSPTTLLHLPSELHLAILDLLDPIDGACLGLAHPHLYALHRRTNGSVPLSSRYSGPNDREWAWRGASAHLRGKDQQQQPLPLDNHRVKGQMYCRKCGISRCELHRHLRDWFGRGWEYCDIKEMYGAPAAAHTRSYCYMPSPKNPFRCGRHGAKRLRGE